MAVLTYAFVLIFKNPYKTALASLLSSLSLLLGSLGLPEIKGPINIDFALWSYLNIKATNLEIFFGTPPGLWLTAYISVVFLIVVTSYYLYKVIENSTSKNG